LWIDKRALLTKNIALLKENIAFLTENMALLNAQHRDVMRVKRPVVHRALWINKIWFF